MSIYALDDLTLEVRPKELEERADLVRLWSNLSWTPTDPGGSNGRRARAGQHISVRLHDRPMKLPDTAALLFTAEGFSVLEDDQDVYVSDGASVFHLQANHSQADAYLHRSFFSKALPLQCNFWSFGLLKLLRPLGFYSLHAACLVAPEGWGMLISAPSGSGKSTLAIGLVRKGWGYLSDDAVLLRVKPDHVSALALRKHFYVDDTASAAYADLPMGEQVSDRTGGQRRRLDLEDVYSGQKVRESLPRMLLFPKIVKQARSSLHPLNKVAALKHLLAASGPQLFDRRSMAQHFDTLGALLKQARAYELHAGIDLYQDPASLRTLLQEAEIKVE